MATSESQKKATLKYISENLEEVRFRVPKGKRAEIQAVAEQQGLSMAAYLIGLIERDSGISIREK